MSTSVLTVGSIRILAVSDGGVEQPPARGFPQVSRDEWEPFREFLAPSGDLPYNLGCYLIREGDTWTLVDTGFGERPGSPGGALLAGLERHGVRPDDIGRVILTHLHVDHVGGCTTGLDDAPVPVFSHARHVLQRREWETRRPSGEVPPHIPLCAEPLEAAGLLDLIDGDRALSPGISTLLTPGHTPGHQSVLIASGEDKVLIFGDLSHTPAQVSRPEWSHMIDHDGAEAARSRDRVMDRIEQGGWTIAAGHYPHPGFGTIVRIEGGRRWRPLG